MASTSRRILILTFDVIGPRLGGAAIRVLGLARGLHAHGHLPTLVTTQLETDGIADGIAVHHFDPNRARETLQPFLASSEVVVLPLLALKRLPFLERTRVPLVIDIYDPVLFEVKAGEQAEHLALLDHVLRRGDFFLCASERQRDFWLGALRSSGRSQPDELIKVVPFGIDPAPAPIPKLEGGRKNIVWPGGIWDWTDPETLVEAMRLLSETSPEIQLTFFAGKHPGEDHAQTAAARNLRKNPGRNIHFIDHYIPFAERGAHLAQCAAAVSTHRATLESHFAYRTRLLDCIWAGLPIVCTEGDVFAELVVREKIGLVVPPENPAALARALARIATDADLAEQCRARIIRIRPRFDWNDAVAPLAQFCLAPRVTHIFAPAPGVRAQVRSARGVLKTHGPRETMRRLKQHLRNR